MKLKKICIFLSCFINITLASEIEKNYIQSTTPNITFNINKAACLLGQFFISPETDSPDFTDFSKTMKDMCYQEEELIDIGLVLYRKKTDKTNIIINSILKNELWNSNIPENFSNTLKDNLLKYDPIFEKKFDELNAKKVKFIKTQQQGLPWNFFSKVFYFYKTELPEDFEFNVYLYPSKNIKTKTASVFENTIFLPLMYNPPHEDFGIILYEICKILYANQDFETTKRIENFFLQNTSEYAIAMYLLLNEVLATAIGKRWAYAQTDDEDLSKKKLCESTYINGISNAILPLVSKYLNKEKQIDKDFLQKTIDILEKDFKNSNKAFEIMFLGIDLITEDKKSFQKYYEIFKENFQTRWVFDEKNFRISSYIH